MKGKKRRVVRGKVKQAKPMAVEAPKPKKEPPPWQVFTKVNEFFSDCQKLEGRQLSNYIRGRHDDLFDESPPKRATLDDVKRRVAYELQWRGYKDADVLHLFPDKVRDRREASAQYKLEAFDERIREIASLGLVKLEDGTMATKTKAAKGDKAPRKTITSAMIQVLSRAKVGTNEEVTAEIMGMFPDSKFNAKHLGWYKTKFKAGELSGMDGPREINQVNGGRTPSEGGEAKAKPAKAAKAKTGGKAKGGKGGKKVVRRSKAAA